VRKLVGFIDSCEPAHVHIGRWEQLLRSGVEGFDRTSWPDISDHPAQRASRVFGSRITSPEKWPTVAERRKRHIRHRSVLRFSNTSR
jgi:hypothetical protein